MVNKTCAKAMVCNAGNLRSNSDALEAYKKRIGPIASLLEVHAERFKFLSL